MLVQIIKRGDILSKELVVYKNELNTIPLRKFNAKEMDLFFSICSKMRDKSTEIVRFDFSELKQLSNYKMTSTKHFMSDLENVYDKLLSLSYREEKDLVVKKFQLFTYFEINGKEKIAEIGVNPRLEYVLNQLTNEFTQFELEEFTKLKSSYSKSMYRLLKQFKSTGFYTVKVDDFKELLDVSRSYNTMSKLDEKVLNPIKSDLSDYFEPFEIRKIKAKKGNKIERLEFIFREKIVEDEELPYVPLFNWLEGDK